MTQGKGEFRHYKRRSRVLGRLSRGPSLVQTALLFGSCLPQLHSTVYSVDSVPVFPPNLYPNLDAVHSNRTNESKQRRKAAEDSLPTEPRRMNSDPQVDAAPRPTSQITADLPTASTAAQQSRSAGLYTTSATDRRLYREFMDWCKQVLGIQTVLEIQTFEYYNYMKAMPLEDWDDTDDDMIDEDVRAPPVESLPTIPVRGLAATRDIREGETIIRIPVQALFSVATTIDNDPVLSRVMGPKARRKHGWDSTAVEEDDDAAGPADGLLLEIPLLAVALLHHKKLGESSPLLPYFRILERTPVDSFPFLWSNAKLKREVSEGIRTVARNIRREIKDMYVAVVQVLIDEHPDIFGNQTARSVDSDDRGDDPKESARLDAASHPSMPADWMFSFEHFQWAFAIVNSRHWQLPIPDLGTDPLKQSPIRHEALSQEDQMLIPPADMPTEDWIQQDQTSRNSVPLHSFLAPVADLLNFGPPCTRGRYDETTHSFEIIASCSFLKGQEVTFWYSNECDHVMAGVYGFTHPLVPKCPSAEEYRRMSEEWQKQAKDLDEELERRNQLVAHLDAEVLFYQNVLEQCSCCRYERHDGENSLGAEDDHKGEDHPTTLLRHEHVRGASHNGEQYGRRRVRKKHVDDETDEF